MSVWLTSSQLIPAMQIVQAVVRPASWQFARQVAAGMSSFRQSQKCWQGSSPSRWLASSHPPTWSADTTTVIHHHRRFIRCLLAWDYGSSSRAPESPVHIIGPSMNRSLGPAAPALSQLQEHLPSVSSTQTQSLSLLWQNFRQ
jgi:hypothetical protein